MQHSFLVPRQFQKHVWWLFRAASGYQLETSQEHTSSARTRLMISTEHQIQGIRTSKTLRRIFSPEFVDSLDESYCSFDWDSRIESHWYRIMIFKLHCSLTKFLWAFWIDTRMNWSEDCSTIQDHVWKPTFDMINLHGFEMGSKSEKLGCQETYSRMDTKVVQFCFILATEILKKSALKNMRSP